MHYYYIFFYHVLQALGELFKKNPREKYIVGHDIAGLVVEVGEGVSNVQVGDTVIGQRLKHAFVLMP